MEIQVDVAEEEQDEARARVAVEGGTLGQVEASGADAEDGIIERRVIKPPKQDEYLWVWKVCLFLWFSLEKTLTHGNY
jgi:hypothetical protein